jgi:5'-phosphate synthase pdxT subunit
MVTKTTIGVLALQGDFLEHITALGKIGVCAKEVRLPQDLEAIDGIILPGGESTTMTNLLDVFDLRKPLAKHIAEGLPVWGTCAGMILLAKKLLQERPTPLKVMDIVVDRNAFGRQIDSFSVPLRISPLGDKALHATFIRAPKIIAIGPTVTVLSKLTDGTIVAAQQNTMLATSFHPELTQDTRLHEFFLSLVNRTKAEV